MTTNANPFHSPTKIRRHMRNVKEHRLTCSICSKKTHREWSDSKIYRTYPLKQTSMSDFKLSKRASARTCIYPPLPCHNKRLHRGQAREGFSMQTKLTPDRPHAKSMHYAGSQLPKLTDIISLRILYPCRLIESCTAL